MLYALAMPEVQQELLRRRGRREFVEGQAAGYLLKAAGENSVPVYALSGRLYLSKSGWLLMAIPHSLIYGLFQALDVAGAELPLKDGKLTGHCSVMTADEVAGIGADNISERGKRYSYGLGPVHEIKPTTWTGVSRVWAARLISPELKALRKSYGLTPLPHNNEYEFHATFAIRRTGILGPNDKSKTIPAAGK